MLQPQRKIIFKQIILILIGVGFLLGFYSSTEKSFSAKSLETAGAFESEKENSESESDDLKFLSQDERNSLRDKFLQQLANEEIRSFSQYFPEVPVSPPNV